MLSVVFGLGAALGFGASDFFGGMSSRHMGALRTVWVTGATSLVVLLLGSLLLVGTWSPDALFFGALSGLSGVFALVCLYASLAIGPMSILSPVGAVVGALLPTIWDFFVGVPLSWFAYLAILCALLAVALVGFSPEKDAVRPSIRGLVFAVLAGTGFAAYYVLLDLAPDDAGLTPLIANRGVSTLLATISVALVVLLQVLRSRNAQPGLDGDRSDISSGERGVVNWRAGLPTAIGAGVIEAVSTALVLYGLVAGNLTVVSVLTSLYPAGTIVLATLILKERIGRLQYVGLGIGLLAAVALALA